MDMHGFHRDVDEVRVIIGPKFDMLIKLDGDHEELNFTESLRNSSTMHQEERSGRPRTQCASRCRFRQRIEDSYSTPEAATTSSLREKPGG